MNTKKINHTKAAQAVRDFLEALNINLSEAGMEKTPERVADFYAEIFNGRGKESKEIWGETFRTEAGGMVAVQHIPFYSMCEHHLVPFFGEVQLAYLPHEGKVAGFSKFTRLVEIIAHRPQLQERMTKQIADAVANDLKAEGVLVIVTAQQLCMMMRGELAPGAKTVTAESTGLLKENEMLQKQAWQLLIGEVK